MDNPTNDKNSVNQFAPFAAVPIFGAENSTGQFSDPQAEQIVAIYRGPYIAGGLESFTMPVQMKAYVTLQTFPWTKPWQGILYSFYTNPRQELSPVRGTIVNSIMISKFSGYQVQTTLYGGYYLGCFPEKPAQAQVNGLVLPHSSCIASGFGGSSSGGSTLDSIFTRSSPSHKILPVFLTVAGITVIGYVAGLVLNAQSPSSMANFRLELVLIPD